MGNEGFVFVASSGFTLNFTLRFDKEHSMYVWRMFQWRKQTTNTNKMYHKQEIELMSQSSNSTNRNTIFTFFKFVRKS